MRVLAAAGIFVFSSLLFSQLVDSGEAELPPGHAECSFLGPNRERFLHTGLLERTHPRAATILTNQVVSRMTAVPADGTSPTPSQGTIDQLLFQAMADAGVTPAARTNDFEFIRRVTLDLTGRVPTPERLLPFVTDSSPDKRRLLVEELLGSEGWVDKWTMYFGDLLKNSQRAPAINRFPDGRDAFHQWIRESLASDKPLRQLATELIAASGDSNFEQGELNWLLGGVVMGSPRSGQDHADQMASNIAETFLGLAHVDCLLCHDGRRHLDNISLWGSKALRYEAWGFSSYLSRVQFRATRVSDTGNFRYYQLADNERRPDYPLNTQTGNRPPRQPIGTLTNVPPKYLFSGDSPGAGEPYRVALARAVTGDVQFARNIVNRIWKEFFSLALVEPVNQFDPARLDPDNPPPEPWSLQANQPRLLNALAQDFIDSGYDLKALMREIVNSEAYQLSSRYEGEWDPDWEGLYARHYVRRLWAEEIHDAIVDTSGIGVTYRTRSGVFHRAMLFPEPFGFPGGRNSAQSFLDSFFRGDRDEEPRRSDGSAIQALNLMNDPFVVERTQARWVGAQHSLALRYLDYPDYQLVAALYLTVLSRYPTEQEWQAAQKHLSAGPRVRGVEDLQWALYNKVDFIFNY